MAGVNLLVFQQCLHGTGKQCELCIIASDHTFCSPSEVHKLAADQLMLQQLIDIAQAL